MGEGGQGVTAGSRQSGVGSVGAVGSASALGEAARALVARLQADGVRPLTRFAPAPTGALHLGHIVNAIVVWGVARASGGRVLLRIEDHDRQRARAEFERALLDDLDWLGFAADLYPTDAYRQGACEARQSERDAIYRDAIVPLISQGLVYGCTCSRRDIDGRSKDRPLRVPHAIDDGPDAVDGPDARSGRSSDRPTPARDRPEPAVAELRYPGTCRDSGVPLGDDVGWRVRIEPGVESFVDALCGPQEQDPSAQCGDLLLRDRRGNWTYQLAVVVDDWRQDVDLVIRGTDILASTGRQILLARLLGRAQPPRFAHHGLVMKSPRQKLSKSDGDTGIGALRDAGWTADRVIGHAASLVGLNEAGKPLPASAVAELFWQA